MKPFRHSPGLMGAMLAVIISLVAPRAPGQQSADWDKCYFKSDASKKGITIYQHKYSLEKILKFENSDPNRVAIVTFRLSWIVDESRTRVTREITKERFVVEIPPKSSVTHPVVGTPTVEIVSIARKAPSTPNPFAPFAPRKPD